MYIRSKLMYGLIYGLFLAPFVYLPAQAASSGIDSTTNTLPIAVDGQTAIMLSADTSGSSTPAPQVSFSGPITEGNTTIDISGNMTVGSSTATNNPWVKVYGLSSFGKTTDTKSNIDLTVYGQSDFEGGAGIGLNATGTGANIWLDPTGKSAFNGYMAIGNTTDTQSNIDLTVYGQSDFEGGAGIGLNAAGTGANIWLDPTGKSAFNGYMAIGNTTDTKSNIDLTVYGQSDFEGGAGIGLNAAGTGAATWLDPKGTASFGGTVTCAGGCSSTSDMRLKTSIKPLALSGIDTVVKLVPVTFEWKDPTDSGMKGEQIGFIAQEVQKVVPDVVVTANDKAKTLSLKYDNLIPVLTKAIQEQQLLIQKEQTEIDALKQQLAMTR